MQEQEQEQEGGRLPRLYSAPTAGITAAAGCSTSRTRQPQHTFREFTAVGNSGLHASASTGVRPAFSSITEGRKVAKRLDESLSVTHTPRARSSGSIAGIVDDSDIAPLCSRRGARNSAQLASRQLTAGITTAVELRSWRTPLLGKSAKSNVLQ